jgi:hypothetical protein
VTLLPPLTVAVKVVDWPRIVGLSLVAFRPVIATSVTVMTTLSGVLARPKLSVTVRVKVRSVGVPGAVKVGLIAAASLNVTAGPPVCNQP